MKFLSVVAGILMALAGFVESETNHRFPLNYGELLFNCIAGGIATAIIVYVFLCLLKIISRIAGD